MNVDELGWTGNFVVSSMRVFQGLSAGKMSQPPMLGTAPAGPPLLLPLPPLLLPLLPLLLLLPPEPLLPDPPLLPLLLVLPPPLPPLPPEPLLLPLPLLPLPPLLVPPPLPLLVLPLPEPLLPCPPLLLVLLVLPFPLLLPTPPSPVDSEKLPVSVALDAHAPTAPAHTHNDSNAIERMIDPPAGPHCEARTSSGALRHGPFANDFATRPPLAP